DRTAINESSLAAHALGVVDDLGNVRQPYRRPLAIGYDQRAVVIGRKQLIVGGKCNGLPLSFDAALRGIDGGARQHAADVLKTDAAARDRGRLYLNADRGLLRARHADEADALDLGYLLGKNVVGKVADRR